MNRRNNGDAGKHKWRFDQFHVRVAEVYQGKFRDIVQFLERSDGIRVGSPTEFFYYLLDEAHRGLQGALKDEELMKAARRVEQARKEYEALLAAREAASVSSKPLTDHR